MDQLAINVMSPDGGPGRTRATCDTPFGRDRRAPSGRSGSVGRVVLIHDGFAAIQPGQSEDTGGDGGC